MAPASSRAATARSRTSSSASTSSSPTAASSPPAARPARRSGPTSTSSSSAARAPSASSPGARLRLHPAPAYHAATAWGFASFAAALDAQRTDRAAGCHARGAAPLRRHRGGPQLPRRREGVHLLLAYDEGDEALVEVTLRIVDEVCADAGASAAGRAPRRALDGQAQRRRRAGGADLPGLRRRHHGGRRALARPAGDLRRNHRGACSASRARSPPAPTSRTRTPTAPASTSPSPARSTPTSAPGTTARSGTPGSGPPSPGGAALSHHHGVGLARSRFVAEALGPAFDVLVASEGGARPERHPEPGQARPAQPVGTGGLVTTPPSPSTRGPSPPARWWRSSSPSPPPPSAPPSLDDGSGAAVAFGLVALAGFLAGGWRGRPACGPTTPWRTAPWRRSPASSSPRRSPWWSGRAATRPRCRQRGGQRPARHHRRPGRRLAGRRLARHECSRTASSSSTSARRRCGPPIVSADAPVDHVHATATPARHPAPGLVEFDAVALADAAIDCAAPALADAGGPVGARRHHQPAGVDDRVGPGDRRAGRPGTRLAGPPHRRRLPRAPGRGHPRWHRTCRPPRSRHLLDQADPDRTPRPVRRHRRHMDGVAPVRRAAARHRPHQRRAHRAAPTATCRELGRRRSSTALRIPRRGPAPTSSTRPASSATASALPGAPPIAGLVGDQQASLLGQGCIVPGLAKITFGTGGMLDTVAGRRAAGVPPAGRARLLPDRRPPASAAAPPGASRRAMLSAGHERRVAARRPRPPTDERGEPRPSRHRCPTPAGRGTCRRCSASARRAGTTAPGARSSASPGARRPPTSCGPCSRASPTAAPTSSRRPRPTAASRSPRSASTAACRPTRRSCRRSPTRRGGRVEVSPVAEATTLGAAFLAGLAVGTWSSLEEVAAHLAARPTSSNRRRRPTATGGATPWTRASAWIPELSALDF